MVLPGLLAFGLAHASEAPKVTVQPLADQLQSAQGRLRAARSQKERVEALKELRERIQAQIRDIAPSETGAKEQLLYHLIGTRNYLDRLRLSEIARKDCAGSRESVIFGFSPKDDQPDVEDYPSEAADVLRLLATACEDPKLSPR
jgi:hypothetical protein